jgi:hypothetical protein
MLGNISDDGDNLSLFDSKLLNGLMKLSGLKLFDNRCSLALPNFGEGFLRMPPSGFFNDACFSLDGDLSVELLREFSRDALRLPLGDDFIFTM